MSRSNLRHLRVVLAARRCVYVGTCCCQRDGGSLTLYQDTEPVNLSTLLAQLLLPALRLHLLPKLSVDVHVLVLEADTEAAVLSAGLSACCAAIADAGIPMSGLAVGTVVVSLCPERGAALLPRRHHHTKPNQTKPITVLPRF